MHSTCIWSTNLTPSRLYVRTFNFQEDRFKGYILSKNDTRLRYSIYTHLHIHKQTSLCRQTQTRHTQFSYLNRQLQLFDWCYMLHSIQCKDSPIWFLPLLYMPDLISKHVNSNCSQKCYHRWLLVHRHNLTACR